MNIKKEITFGTSNPHKVEEAIAVLENYNFNVKQHEVDLLEIQDDNLENIATTSLLQLPDKTNYFVEDTGLFISSLKGFPGPYAAYVLKTISNEGILRLMKNFTNREAYFKSVIAYRDKNNEIMLFSGEIHGEISHELKGTVWGFDPIFIPHSKEFNSNFLTFAKMDMKSKNSISHRAIALDKLGNFLNQF
ncbi:MAG: RdgB/HAM1 family non-canonical purine NTP pyrophosphatase [Candidatus Hodarchaeales archaeon]|jgi:XTP/dITP diphosphohydrolase